MKLKSMEFTNFRCFESLKINFDQNLTVFIASNGSGKTSILDAIAYGYGPYLSRLPKISGIGIKKDIDIYINHDGEHAPFLRLDLFTEDMHWDLTQRRDLSKKTRADVTKPHGRDELLKYADSLIDAENEKQPYTLPIIAYYGTDRAFDPVSRRENFKKEFSRFEAYSGALRSSANFRRLFEWFNAMENIERRGVTEHRDFDYKLPELEAVRKAIGYVLPKVSNPRIEMRPVRFLVDFEQNGVSRTFRIEQLSDGYKMALAMVMDIAARMGEANPDEDNILETGGVVLIDEVDQHLHPSWQQRILADLTRTFPNVQFIVTTHSPQVLSTVSSKSIRLLEHETDHETGRLQSFAREPSVENQGVASSYLMAEFMGVDPVPDMDQSRWLSEYKAMIQLNQSETHEGLKLRRDLEEHFGPRHKELLECDRMLRLEKMKSKLSMIKAKDLTNNKQKD
jgi:predicted ATP-binding protein involved in virulence